MRTLEGAKMTMRLLGSFKILVVIFFTLGLIPIFSSDIHRDYETPTQRKNGETSYSIHSPILIQSNDDFANQATTEGWPGEGTSSSPYIIQGYSIETASGSGIYIEDVTVHFIISGCNIWSSGESTRGIEIRNASSAKIESCLTSDHLDGISASTIPMLNISSNTATSSSFGFVIFNCNNSIVSGNYLNDNNIGITLAQMSGCDFSKNTFINCSLHIFGSKPEFWMHQIENNTVNGKPLGYLINNSRKLLDISSYGAVVATNLSDIIMENGTFESASFAIELGFCINTTVRNLEVTNQTQGIRFHYCTNCCIMNVNANHNEEGFVYSNSYGCKIYTCSILGCDYQGVSIHSSDSTMISNNTIKMNEEGIRISYSDYSMIMYNNVSLNSENGIEIQGAEYCQVFNNTVYENTEYGIVISSGTNNQIFYNWIGWNEKDNACDDGESNLWDDNVNLGNYWSDHYFPTAYSITGSAGSVDRYPRAISDELVPSIYIDNFNSNPLENEPVTITATILDVSPLAEILLLYSIDNGDTWLSVSMELIEVNRYAGTIPGVSAGIEVQFKIQATDQFGHTGVSTVESYTVEYTDIITTTTSESTTSNGTVDSIIPIFLSIGVLVGGLVIVSVFYFSTKSQ